MEVRRSAALQQGPSATPASSFKEHAGERMKSAYMDWLARDQGAPSPPGQFDSQ
jgi:hypothetical protein